MTENRVPWGLIVDISSIESESRTSHLLRVALAHVDFHNFIQHLLVDLENFELTPLYDELDEALGNSLTETDWGTLVHEIDYLYRTTQELLQEFIQPTYRDESFRFHKWLDKTTVLIGSPSLQRKETL